MTAAEFATDLAAPPTGRLQLALNVDNLDEAIDFYTKMFGTGPVKVKPGYANFAIAAPPLKLVLFSGVGDPGTINHLGVEVPSADAVAAAEQRLTDVGLATTDVAETTCCFAAKTETWLEAPDGQRWEWYVKNDDIAEFGADSANPEIGNSCCP